jgi:general secretion pathway protein F
MPVFAYRALNAGGKTVRGVIDADTPQKARQRLRSDGLHPIDVRMASGSEAKGGRGRSTERSRRSFRFGRGRLSLLSDITRQLSTLLAAGLPLVTALSTIQEQTEDSDFGHHLALIREDITGGESLAGAFTRHPQYFPPEYVHLVRAGEMSGALDSVLERLADDLEKRRARRAGVTAALAYPAFMILVGGAVLFFLLSFIVPTLTGLFDNLGAALPWPTRLLLAVSGFLKDYWWAVIIFLGILILLFRHYIKKTDNFRRVEALLFRVPLVGSLMQRLLLAQALRSLAVMTGGGVNLTTALSVTAKGLGKSAYGSAMEEAARMVGQGRSLADGFEISGLFPPVAKRMVAVGEASGTLTDMLARVARNYEEETDRVLAALTSLVEPIIILVMGLMVGFVVMAVLIPIFDLSGLVG